MKYFLLSILFFLQTSLYAQQFTEQTSISLTGVFGSSLAWGDYDNDGDLDILLTGDPTGGGYVSKIYRNNGNNTFSAQTSIALTGVQASSVAWGDYDNDGDLDILLTGATLSYNISKIYRNDGNNSFSEQISIALASVSGGSVAWGDYDNDGDLDILLTGYLSSGGYVSKIYRNNGNNTFTEQTSIALTGVGGSSVTWGDYDNDGDLDILLTGRASISSLISKIYRNDGNNTFTEQTSIALTGVYNSSIALGDYDNDGDLDILLSGEITNTQRISKVYRNNGNNTFSEQTSIALTGVGGSSVAWGDYDNDGDLDILLTGYNGSSEVSKIYQNNGNGTFTEQTSISLIGVASSSVAWGDYDNDGDLDILLSGWSAGSKVAKLYRNNSSVQNTLPSSPMNLTSISGSEAILSWNKSTDNETPQNGLKYNLVIGTSPNSVNVLSPMSSRTNGYRRVISLGNVNHRNSWTIKGLANGTYYWSVQTIDNAFAGSNFSPEQSFTITPIKVTTPNGGENWEVGSIQNITWTDNISENVKIDLWNGGFYVSTITTSAPSNGSYLWTVPIGQTAGTDYKIRICSALNDNLFDFSDNNFTITPMPSITITTPNGGENWEVGSVKDITWTDNLNENVKIELYKGGLSNSTIINSTPSIGSYGWLIPMELASGTDYKIKISSTTNSAVSDFSDNNFSLKESEVEFVRIEFYEIVNPNLSNPMNLINVGSKIRFKLCIVNILPQNILTAYGVIKSTNPNVVVTDSNCTFNNVLSGQTAWSVDELEIEPNNNVPLGSFLNFSLTVRQVLNPTGPWYSSFSFPIVPIKVGDVYTDDDNNPDSQGNANGIAEPNETIEVVPLVNSLINQPFYQVKGTLNSPYSFINVWNNVLGASGYVYNTYRYNLISNQHQPILPYAQNIQPEVDYVFGYNAANIYQLPFNLIFTGHYGSDSGLYFWDGGVKMKWSSRFVINQGQPPVSVKENSDQIPNRYNLFQNYPDPFNPSTKISWQSPVSSWQTLKVYDVLGNEVETLVDEYKPAGSYEVEFSARGGQASGIYFYQLRAGEFVETKKMILLR